MPKDGKGEVVNLLGSDLSKMSKNERLKVESQGLFWVAGKNRHSFRSEVEALARGEQASLSNEAKEISKHLGIYKQQQRIEGRKSGDQIVMVRLRVPSGGEFTAGQWAACCEAADRWADGSLRLTTRQGIQFHHIQPRDLGAIIRFLNDEYPTTGYRMSTLGACGDVNRNTMCSPIDDLLPGRDTGSRELAFRIADELAPRSSAYYQIFLTDEAGKIEEPLTADEPIYGEYYLPRKFKVGIAHPEDNSVDALTQDVGLIPVCEGPRVVGYDLYSGGGLGTTHGNPRTQALLGLYLGRIPADQVVEAVKATAILQKENGERKDRKQARWKYTIRRLGAETVQREMRERFGLRLEDVPAQPVPPNRFFHGWHDEAGDRLFLGLPVPSGRLKDDGGVRARSAVSALVADLGCGVRITGNQDLLLTHIDPGARARAEQILDAHGVARPESVSTFRRQAFGCPALPTCGLAMTEAEGAIPGLSDAVEEAGLGHVDAVVRMAGCPNHCSRPPSAEIGITGYGKNAHMIRVGASRSGDRMARVLYDKVGSEQLPDVLVGLLRAIDAHAGDTPPGDWLNEMADDELRSLVGVEI